MPPLQSFTIWFETSSSIVTDNNKGLLILIILHIIKHYFNAFGCLIVCNLTCMFQDATVGLYPIPESQQTYSNFLGSAMETIMGVRDCPVAKMTVCVTSDAEKNKCVKMKVRAYS